MVCSTLPDLSRLRRGNQPDSDTNGMGLLHRVLRESTEAVSSSRARWDVLLEPWTSGQSLFCQGHGPGRRSEYTLCGLAWLSCVLSARSSDSPGRLWPSGSARCCVLVRCGRRAPMHDDDPSLIKQASSLYFLLLWLHARNLSNGALLPRPDVIQNGIVPSD